eukprot:m.37345 g.37345  ORF g.37345 m.37345 type:complete len:438 (-) comp9303_c0_seq1:103-1416(-)
MSLQSHKIEAQGPWSRKTNHLSQYSTLQETIHTILLCGERLRATTSRNIPTELWEIILFYIIEPERKIKVFVRVCPRRKEEERALGARSTNGKYSIQVCLSVGNGLKTKEVEGFDGVFWSEEPHLYYANQQQVYQTIGVNILNDAFRGINSCVIAYGDFGCGKRYSIRGLEDDPGLFPRLLADIFQRISENKEEDVEYRVEMSYLNIHRERIRDLLTDSSQEGPAKRLRVRENRERTFYVENLTKVVLKNYDHGLETYNAGNEESWKTLFDYNYSSHSYIYNVLSIRLSQLKKTEEITSEIKFVESAGTSRKPSNMFVGDGTLLRHRPLQRQCVIPLILNSLAKQQQSEKVVHIPWRDSIISRLLKENLVGNSVTTVLGVVNADFSAGDETYRTLRHCELFGRLKTKPIVNNKKTSQGCSTCKSSSIDNDGIQIAEA